MRIFASWSGESSRGVAVLLKEWLPSVLQEVEVYVSSQDISKGERWLANVNDNLSEHDVGFSIVTPTNLNAPWILFEAGALAKSLKSRLIPILCGLESIDLPNHPLTQFQYVLANQQAEMFRLVADVNLSCKRPLSEERLRATFEKWYPEFETAYAGIDLSSPKKERMDPAKEIANLQTTMDQVLRELRDTRRWNTQVRNEAAVQAKALWSDRGLPSSTAGLLSRFVSDAMSDDARELTARHDD